MDEMVLAKLSEVGVPIDAPWEMIVRVFSAVVCPTVCLREARRIRDERGICDSVE